jgi:hypothetical protein
MSGSTNFRDHCRWELSGDNPNTIGTPSPPVTELEADRGAGCREHPRPLTVLR